MFEPLKACITVYGYMLYIPSDVPLYMVLAMNELLEEPFQIYNLCISHNSYDMDKEVRLIIGFIPDADLEHTVQMAKDLALYIVDNPLLQGFNTDKTPDFYAGREDDGEEEEEEEEEEDEDDEEEEEEEKDESFPFFDETYTFPGMSELEVSLNNLNKIVNADEINNLLDNIDNIMDNVDDINNTIDDVEELD